VIFSLVYNVYSTRCKKKVWTIRRIPLYAIGSGRDNIMDDRSSKNVRRESLYPMSLRRRVIDGLIRAVTGETIVSRDMLFVVIFMFIGTSRFRPPCRRGRDFQRFAPTVNHRYKTSTENTWRRMTWNFVRIIVVQLSWDGNTIIQVIFKKKKKHSTTVSSHSSNTEWFSLHSSLVVY